MKIHGAFLTIGDEVGVTLLSAFDLTHFEAQARVLAGSHVLAEDLTEAQARLISASNELAQSLMALLAWQHEVKHAVPLSYLEGARKALKKAAL